MRVSVSEETRVPLEETWRWWTDFGQPGDEFDVRHGMAKSRRRILERTDARVVFEERAPLPGAAGMKLVRYEVDIEPDHRLRERAEGISRHEATWRFESTPAGGTRITRDLETRVRGLDFTGKLGEKVAREMMEKDLEHHIKELEREKGLR